MRMDTKAEATVIPYPAIMGRISEMRARCEPLMEPPWHVVRSGTGASLQIYSSDFRIASAVPSRILADFIAHARADLPAVLDALELAVKALEREVNFSNCDHAAFRCNETLRQICAALTKGTK